MGNRAVFNSISGKSAFPTVALPFSTNSCADGEQSFPCSPLAIWSHNGEYESCSNLYFQHAGKARTSGTGYGSLKYN